MFKNKSYIGIALIILVFGIYSIPKIVSRFQNNSFVSADRLDASNNNTTIVNEKLVTIGKAPLFSLQNQNGIQISNKDFKNKVYVLEFFFTKCPSICPKMNQSMLEIQKTFFGNPNFGILSITIDPENDTSEVLKNHAKLLGASMANWHFLTGDKATIFNLSNKGFNLYTGQNSKVAGGFEHSGLFALVDKNGNIRCRKDDFENPILYYDGLEKSGVKAIQEDIKLLLNE